MSRRARLDAAMERAGLSMHSLSSRSKLSRTSLYKFLRGVDIRLSVLERLAKALDVSPAWLAWGIDAQKLSEGALRVSGDVLDPITAQWVEDVRREVPGAVVVFEQTRHMIPP